VDLNKPQHQKVMNRKLFLTLIFLQLCTIILAQTKQSEVFVCIPCGNGCDSHEYTSGGKCEHCNMDLVLKSSIKHKSVSPEKVCRLITTTPGILLLDVRTKEEFDGTSEMNPGTLKNAINIPIDELPNRLSELSAHKNKTILVFCSHSHRSPRASYLLTQKGFKNVVNMEGGMSVMNDASCKK
jgi:rhodanese-related sulfurtransferase